MTTFETTGRPDVVAGPGGFSIVRSGNGQLATDAKDLPGITVFDVFGNELSVIREPFSDECGAADTFPGGRRVILTEHIVRTPARGIEAATSSTLLTAWDGTTGKKMWEQVVIPPSPPEAFPCTQYSESLRGFSSTADGKWGVFLGDFGQEPIRTAVELETGRLIADRRLLGTVGNYTVISDDPTADPATSVFTIPGEWSHLGEVATGVRAKTGIGWSGDRSPDMVTMRGDRTAISPDGTTLVGAHDEDSTQPPHVVAAYDLPTGAVRWSRRFEGSIDDGLVAITNSRVVTRVLNRDGGQNKQEFRALDLRTGADAWTLPSGAVCGVTDKQLLLYVNRQLATIDMATGKQVDYQDAARDGTAGPACEHIIDGGIRVESDRIVQALDP